MKTISRTLHDKIDSKFFRPIKNLENNKLLGVVKTPIKTLSVYSV